MVELVGDSARGDQWAAVRVRVDDGRVVDADADGLAQELRGLTLLEAAADGGVVYAAAAGLAQDLRGLTLLEAAAVGGETLPVDALANALGPAVRASAD